jgi:hypothetical protein
MGDTLLSNDDEKNHRLFPFSSPSQFFMNSPDVTRGMTLALMIVLVIIPENFTVISPGKNTYLPSLSLHTQRVDWFSHE